MCLVIAKILKLWESVGNVGKMVKPMRFLEIIESKPKRTKQIRTKPNQINKDFSSGLHSVPTSYIKEPIHSTQFAEQDICPTRLVVVASLFSELEFIILRFMPKLR